MNKIKQIKRTIVALLLFFFVPSFSQQPSDVCYIPAREYSQVVAKEIDNAQHSVRVVLYLFSLYKNSPQ